MRFSAWILGGLSVLALGACASSDDSSQDCRCPAGGFFVTVPADRAADVQAVSATGACSNPSELAELKSPPDAAQPSDEFSVFEDDVGTCHLSVTFKSGAPEFDTDVQLVRGTVGCQASCSPVPSAPVSVPE